MNTLIRTVKKYVLPLLMLLVVIISLLLFYRNSQQISALNRQVHHQLSQLDNNTEQEKFTSINSEISMLKQQVGLLSDSLMETGEKLSDLQHQIGEVNKRTQRDLSEQEQGQISNQNELQTLKKQVAALTRQLEVLSETRSLAPAISAKPPSKPVISLPFKLIGIEQRGGLLFAAILPHQAAGLAEIRLIEPGQQVQGWELLAINAKQARFSRAGQIRTLTR